MDKRNEVPYIPHSPDYSGILNANAAIDADCSGNFGESITDQLFNSSNIYEMSYGDELIRRNDFGFFEKLKRIKPQIKSVLGGYLLLLISGLHVVLGIWWLEFMNPFTDDGRFICILLAYNISAIIGGVIAGFLINTWRKQAIYYLSGSVMVISSFILIIWGLDEVGVLFGRAMAGLGHGICYNVVVIHAGENAMKETRGVVMSAINSIMWSSIFFGSSLLAIIRLNASTEINFDRIFGIISLAISIISMICTRYWTEESVVHLLNQGKLGEALEVHTKLRKDQTEPETDDFEEIRLMVVADKEENKNIFNDNNGRPLTLMVTIKILNVLCNNSLVYWIFIWYTFTFMGPKFIVMGPVMLSGLRLLGSVLQTLLADSYGRRVFILISCALSGISFISIQIVMFSKLWSHEEGFITFSILFVLSLGLQVFISCGIDPIHHTLLSEVFPTSKKNWSVVFVTTWENAVEFLIIGLCFVDGPTLTEMYSLYLFVPAIYMFVLAIILYYSLPETLGLSLSETKVLTRNMTIRWCCMKRW